MKYMSCSSQLSPFKRSLIRRNTVLNQLPLIRVLIFSSDKSKFLKAFALLIYLFILAGSPVSQLSGKDNVRNKSGISDLNIPLAEESAAITSVPDNLPPNAVCKNITVYLGVTGTVTITGSDIDGGSNDPDGTITSLMVSPSTFTCSEAGINAVTLTVTDNGGLSSICTSQVTVLDNLPPTVNAKTFNLILGPAGTATLLPSNVDNGSFDNCGPVTLSVSPNTFSCSDAGKKIVALTAVDSHGNSASRNITITVSSSLEIISMSLHNCNLAVPYSLYQSEIEGGDGNYSYFWKGINEASKPFLIILPVWPYLQFSNTSTSATPFFNNTMPAGPYGIRLVVTDGNGCKDTSEILINMSGPLFDNKTYRHSKACKDEVRTYTVIYESEATYSWVVQNGTIMNSDTDTSRISVLWSPGLPQGVVIATVTRPNLIGETCQYSVTDTVSIDASPVPSFNNPVTNVCSNSENTYFLTGSYTFHHWTVTGGNITGGGTTADNFVTVRWGNGPAGNVMVTVENANSCSGSVFVNISISDLTGTITSLTDVTCNGASDGTVTALATPGSGLAPYQYSLNGGLWQPGATFTGIPPGNHTVSIRDALLCISDLPFAINQPSPLTGAVSAQTNVSCSGGSDGSVIISSSGGVSPYMYSLNGGLFQGSNTFNGLTAGTYTITIRDNNNCQTTVPVVVTQPAAPLGGTMITTNILCFGESTGTINLTVAGGTTPYTFLWNNGATTEDLVNLSAGNYIVTITDANACSAIENGTLTEPSSAVSGTIVSQTNILCFGGNNGTVSVTGSGGVGPYQYLIGGGTYQVSGSFGALTAGTYNITIRDANLCTFIIPVTITGPSAALGGSTSALTNVQCFGDATGSITIAGSGGTSPYQYNIDGGSFQPAGIFNGLTAGVHNIIIRDINLCTFSLPVTITQPAAALTGSIISQVDVNCFGDATGSVTIGGSGGTSPYGYSLDAGVYQSSGTFTNLISGTHSVTIRDANMCLFNINVNITQPASALSVTYTKVDVGCFGGSTGSALAIPSGGTSPYNYSWNTIPVQTTAAVSGLAAGTYTVTVTDNKGCTATAGISITQPSAGITATADITDVLCDGATNGAIDLTVENGTAPITYLWSNGTSSQDLINIAAGNYSVIITDASSCTTTAAFAVNQPPPLSGTLDISNVACFGESSGAIDLTPTGGTSPYTFLWNNGAITEDLTGLAPDSYSVTIRDANSCVIIVTGTITQPSSALSGNITSLTDVSEYGGNDGSVTIAGTGGNSSYSYRIGTGSYQSSGTFNNLTAGTYTATIRDNNLCTFDVIVTITQPMIPLTGNISSQTNILCYGGNSGSVTVTGWGGTPPYEYSINGGAYQASGTFGSLAPGTYIVTIRDALMDTFDIPVTITEPGGPLSIVMNQVNILCSGDATGSASATITGGVTPYSYSWNTSPVQTTASVSGLTDGNYSVTVTDANGCTIDGAVQITEPQPLAISATTTSTSCPDEPDGSITLQITGGIAPYSVIWSDGALTQNRTNILADTYIVVVTDQNSCAKSLNVEVDFTGTFNCVEIPHLITPNNDGYNDEWILRNIEIYPNAEVLVYNRWGKLVFRTKNISANPWDGRDNGKLVPTDSYHYILYLNDGSAPRSGVISVIR